ncbi:MAG: methanogenesis marker 6 protein [Methanotrichaceae archaeon]
MITSTESDVLPADIAMKIYGSKHDVNVKETCFGVIINGEEDVIGEVIKEIRAMDPAGIFIKDRGFPPGDRRRCRGIRGGGPRPGFYMLESESKMLPMISRALVSEGTVPVAVEAKVKKPLPPKRLEEIVKEEL